LGESNGPPDGLKLTPEQLRIVRKWRLWLAPLRLVVGLTFFSLLVGGPRRFFSELPGQVFAGLFVFFVMIERFLHTPDVTGERKDEGSSTILWITFGASYVLAFVDWYWIRPHWSLVAWSWKWVVAGCVLFALGETLRLVSIRTLGRYFTIQVRLHEGQRVIRHGVYRVLRHPAYTGLWLVNLGYITLFGSVLGYAAYLLAGLPGLLNRIRVEERAMTERFGAEYTDYCRSTKRLIPFVY
jgi:protein-S-isoprenylcysteine O-methyltransferase